MQIDIIGAPITLGQSRRGTDLGPTAIRYANLREKLESLNHSVADKGNIEAPSSGPCEVGDPKLKYIDHIAPICRGVAEAVASSVQGGRFPLVVGGDHSLSIGSVRGAAKQKKIGVIWLDAHADFNTRATSPSGNIHGMPLAALCGFGDPRLTVLLDETPPVVDPSRVAVLGARDLDAGEKDNLRKAGVLVLSMEQVDRMGINAALEQCLERVGSDTEGVYLSLDLDALDPRFAPAVGTPVPGGFSDREAHLVCEVLAESGKLIGMDLVEVNPLLDEKNRTAQLAVELACSALGARVWTG